MQDPKVRHESDSADGQEKTKFGIVERYEDAAAVGTHAKNPVSRFAIHTISKGRLTLRSISR